MMDEYITRNNAISAVCFGCNQQFFDEPCEPSECSIRQSIMALPTAEVVPKSEVERLQEEIETLKDNNEHLAVLLEESKQAYSNYEETTGLKQAKKEVAREIFAEIEKCSEVALMNGHIETPILCIGLGTLAELKKKYTEEKT